MQEALVMDGLEDHINKRLASLTYDIKVAEHYIGLKNILKMSVLGTFFSYLLSRRRYLVTMVMYIVVCMQTIYNSFFVASNGS